MSNDRLLNNPIVSIIVNAHNEGTLLHRTLKSVNENIINAQKENITVEVIIVADKVDGPTKDYLENRSKLALTSVRPHIEYVEYGDLGLSRNHGFRAAKGKYVGNIDGDDLWGDNWVTGAVRVLNKNDRVVVHPGTVLNFGTKNGIWQVKSSTDPLFDPRSIVEDNWWGSSMMTHRKVFDEVQYKATLKDRRFGFEDWLWNCETLVVGIEHLAVPETVFFYRRKEMSMLVSYGGFLLGPNKLLTPAGLSDYQKYHKSNPVSLNEPKEPAMVAIPSTRWTKSYVRKVTIKSVKVGGKVAVKVGKKYGSNFLNSHHKVKTFVKTVHGAAKTLIEPSMDNGEYISSSLVKPWLKGQWRHANDIEPHLFPTRRRISTLYNRRMMTVGQEARVYWDLADKLGEGIDYLMVLPYIRHAGAYMVAMYYVKAYKQLHPDADVVVLTTENTFPSDKDMVPMGVRFVEAPADFYISSKPLQEKVLAKLFVNLAPKRVHIVHSQEGFRTLGGYGAQISYSSKLYLTTFNYDYTADGQKMNAFVAFAEPILPYVTKVFTDNQWVVDDTIDIYGIDCKLLSAHAMPVAVPDKIPDGTNLREVDGKMRILWAARFAKQKRPDILYEIAREAHKQKLPYEFVVYGEIYDKVISPKLINDLCALPNVQYKGAFHNGLLALPLPSYEVYLNTSEMEGTPNAILEAQAGELVVLAPAVGGIPEVIDNKKSGLLVNDFANVNEYLKALEYIYADQKRSRKIAKTGQDSVKTERSWQAFVDQVAADLE